MPRMVIRGMAKKTAPFRKLSTVRRSWEPE